MDLRCQRYIGYFYSNEYKPKQTNMKATNRISISMRIAQEDADFIAERKMEGANTPSEKICELLKPTCLAHPG